MWQEIIKYIKRHDIDAIVMMGGSGSICSAGIVCTLITGDLTGLLSLLGLPVGVRGADLIQNHYYSEPLGHRVRVVGGDQEYINACKAKGY